MLNKTELERLKRDPDAIERLNEISVVSLKKSIRARRKKMCMTQSELAALTGVNQPTISMLENTKKSKLNLDVLKRVVAGLGCVVNLQLATKTEFLEDLDIE